MSQTMTISRKQSRWGEKLRIVFALAAKDIVDGLKNKTILTLIVSMLFVILMWRLLPLFTAGPEMNVLVYRPESSESLVNAIIDSDQLELWEGYESVAQMQHRLANAEDTEIALVFPPDLEAQLARGNRPEITAYVPYFVTDEEAQEAKQLVEQELAFWTDREVLINVDSSRVFMDMDNNGPAVPLIMTMIYALTISGIVLVPNLMVKEKDNKTMEALLVSPATSGLITAGKALAGLFYTLVAGGLVLLSYSMFILNWPLAIMGVLIGALFAVTLGLILGTAFENRQQLQIVAWVLIIPLMLGYFLSLERALFPDIVGRILNWLPTVTIGDMLMTAFVPEVSWLNWTIDFVYLAGLSVIFSGLVIWLLKRMDR